MLNKICLTFCLAFAGGSLYVLDTIASENATPYAPLYPAAVTGLIADYCLPVPEFYAMAEAPATNQFDEQNVFFSSKVETPDQFELHGNTKKTRPFSAFYCLNSQNSQWRCNTSFPENDHYYPLRKELREYGSVDACVCAEGAPWWLKSPSSCCLTCKRIKEESNYRRFLCLSREKTLTASGITTTFQCKQQGQHLAIALQHDTTKLHAAITSGIDKAYNPSKEWNEKRRKYEAHVFFGGLTALGLSAKMWSSFRKTA